VRALARPAIIRIASFLIALVAVALVVFSPLAVQEWLPSDYDSLRQYEFVHMWVTFCEGRYFLREMSEAQLRRTASSEFFNGRVGRDYWSSSRDRRLSQKGQGLHFAKIIDGVSSNSGERTSRWYITKEGY